MRERIAIFANPTAGRGRGAAVARGLADALDRATFDVSVRLDPPGDVESVDAAAVVVVGGDGTLRGVVESMRRSGREIPPVLPVSMGTANLMSRHLGYRWSPGAMGAAVVDMIRARRTVRLDAGTANGRLFLLMAGIGIDAAIVHELARIRRGPIRLASYVLPAAASLAGYDFPPVSVEVDGRRIFDPEPGVAVIANIKEYGIGLPVLPDADPTDGLLDICVLPCRDWTGLLGIVMAMASQQHVYREGVVHVRGRSVRVTGIGKVPVQLDGDASEFAPVEIQCEPAAVPFLLPPPIQPIDG